MLRINNQSRPIDRSYALSACVLLIMLLFAGCGDPAEQDVALWIQKGEFAKADRAIAELLDRDTALTPERRMALEFERERMRRIRKDFRSSPADVQKYIARWIPDVTEKDLRRWEEERVLERMDIDGRPLYFSAAARNLFRLDPEAKRIWQEKHRDDPPETGLASEAGLDAHIKAVMQAATRARTPFVQPVRLRVTHSLDVDSAAVPDGEILRCWIPFPREIPGRQDNIRLLTSDPPAYILADNERCRQRTIYFEKPAARGKTHFSVTYEYTAHGVYVPVDPAKVQAAKPTEDLLPYLSEEPPHIVFTPELRELSRSIVGDEQNPLRIARTLFAWADTNITWATAREYSTVRNLSMYAFENRHGDCGMQTMLFITLLRMNGIPARWQSGWEFRPPGDSMHDWGMVYFAPYGWVPMDVTYGLRDGSDESFRYFYVNGMDSYRLIFNDATGVPFYPAKIFPRSETIDSQRGEVEWRGGNLYFDRWEWDLGWKVVGN